MQWSVEWEVVIGHCHGVHWQCTPWHRDCGALQAPQGAGPERQQASEDERKTLIFCPDWQLLPLDPSHSEVAVPAPAFLGAGLRDTLSVLPGHLIGCTSWVQSDIVGLRS